MARKAIVAAGVKGRNFGIRGRALEASRASFQMKNFSTAAMAFAAHTSFTPGQPPVKTPETYQPKFPLRSDSCLFKLNFQAPPRSSGFLMLSDGKAGEHTSRLIQNRG